MSINRRQKGARGEREVAQILREKYGFKNARRGQQYSGINGDADVVNALPFIHIEVKRVEQLNIDNALDQAKGDAKVGKVPVVIHRKNGKKWKATLDFNDFMMLYGEYYSSMVLAGRKDDD